MNPEWDGLLLDCRLATMADHAAPYGLVEDGALGWKDGAITYAGAQAALPDAPERLAAHVARADGALVAVQVDDRSGAIMEAARRLSQAGVAAEDIAVRRPTLDDVFLSLTGHAAADEQATAEAERMAVPA